METPRQSLQFPKLINDDILRSRWRAAIDWILKATLASHSASPSNATRGSDTKQNTNAKSDILQITSICAWLWKNSENLPPNATVEKPPAITGSSLGWMLRRSVNVARGQYNGTIRMMQLLRPKSYDTGRMAVKSHYIQWGPFQRWGFGRATLDIMQPESYDSQPLESLHSNSALTPEVKDICE